MIDFNNLIDKHISKGFRAKKIGKYYPSEIGSCLRKIWYSYKYPHEVEPDLLKVFEVGNILHDFIVEVLKSERTPEVELLQAEIPFKINIKDFLVSGRVDDLVLIKESGKNVLVEVKSHRMIKLVKQPEKRHVMQLQFYMHAIGVHNGLIVYVDKGSLKTKVFEVNFNEGESEIISKRFETLHKDLTENILPSSEAKEDSDMGWMCRFCEYKEKCDKNKK